jgi:hypothetical protein
MVYIENSIRDLVESNHDMEQYETKSWLPDNFVKNLLRRILIISVERFMGDKEKFIYYESTWSKIGLISTMSSLSLPYRAWR